MTGVLLPHGLAELGEGGDAVVEVGPLLDALCGEEAVVRVFGGAPLVGDQRPGGVVEVVELRIALGLADEALAGLVDVLAADLEEVVLLAQRCLLYTSPSPRDA